MFNIADLQQMKAKGISPEQVENQISQFKAGFPFLELQAPATIGNGLHQLSNEGLNTLISYFNDQHTHYSILKFVPASGAASRMFKHLFEFRQASEMDQKSKLLKDTGFNSAHYFFKHIEKFAFFEKLKLSLTTKGKQISELLSNGQFNEVLDELLEYEGLNYSNLPKGLLLFHRYEENSRVAMEEHLVEAAVYTANENKVASIHFTVSPEHQLKFEETLLQTKDRIEKEYKTKFEVSFSQQKPSTDTIAVNEQNEPFRNPDGSLLFRPGGHGALIHNLNELDYEIIFIKNIDNIVPDRLRNETYKYKKAIGGLLMKLQEQIFEYLDLLDDGNADEDAIKQMTEFAEKELNIQIPDAFEAYDTIEKVDYLFNKFNRPIRVCGMVKNEGEPGGGPFWALDENQETSLQIVESSQINFNDKKQNEIVKNATHFNPVDLVCGLYNYKGEKFNLVDFVDPETGFVSVKSKDGKTLKALELPGLWNGAMADWITVFVETPIITFNPVKTVNDLLRIQHQPE